MKYNLFSLCQMHMCFPGLYNIYQLVHDYKTESIIKTILPYNMGNLKSG